MGRRDDLVRVGTVVVAGVVTISELTPLLSCELTISQINELDKLGAENGPSRFLDDRLDYSMKLT